MRYKQSSLLLISPQLLLTQDGLADNLSNLCSGTALKNIICDHSHAVSVFEMYFFPPFYWASNSDEQPIFCF